VYRLVSKSILWSARIYYQLAHMCYPSTICTWCWRWRRHAPTVYLCAHGVTLTHSAATASVIARVPLFPSIYR
jgi:hypothetical protein